jgi:ribose 5-phosphate isomerase B
LQTIHSFNLLFSFDSTIFVMKVCKLIVFLIYNLIYSRFSSNSMKIAIGADHAGIVYKQPIIEMLETSGHEVKDFGTFTTDSVDYPDFAHPVASVVENNEADRGILLCGSAQGVSMTANKHQGIRASVVWREEVASLTRQHNDANIICLPARFISEAEALSFVKIFLETEYEGGRHAARVAKMTC